MLPDCSKFRNRNVFDVWIRLPRHKWPKSRWKSKDLVIPHERNLYGHRLAGLLWERQFVDALLELGWEKIPNWECIFVHRKQGLFLSVFVDDIKMDGKNQDLAPVWTNWRKKWILTKPHHFCTMCIWDVLSVNANRMKQSLNNYEDAITKMFESHVTAGAAEKLPGWQRPHAQTVAWSYDMVGHAQKCVERFFELAFLFKHDELESVGELSEVCSLFVLTCLYLARIGRPDIFILWSVIKLARAVTRLTRACDTRQARLIS